MSGNNYLDHVVKMTRGASESLFRNVRAMPEDRQVWKPLDEGRSAIDIVKECTMSPLWFAPILQNRAMPEFSEEDQQKGQQLMDSWKTIDDCEAASKENSEMLYGVIKDFPHEELDKSVRLPFGEGFDATMAEIASFQYWNLVYHWGQLSYIQTLYGDRDMH